MAYKPVKHLNGSWYLQDTKDGTYRSYSYATRERARKAARAIRARPDPFRLSPLAHEEIGSIPKEVS